MAMYNVLHSSAPSTPVMRLDNRDYREKYLACTQ